MNLTPEYFFDKYEWFARGKPLACVYCIVNNKDEILYVGSTENLKRRIKNHIDNYKYNMNSQPKLYNYIFENKGFEKFDFVVKEVVYNIKKLSAREQMYYDDYNPMLNTVRPNPKTSNLFNHIEFF